MISRKLKKSLNQITKIFYSELSFLLEHLRLKSYRRGMIAYLEEKDNNNLVGIEIGSREGENALEILKRLNIEHLYLIDPYISYYEADGIRLRDEKFQDKCKEECIKRLRNYNNWELITKTSNNAIKDIKKKVDFVYIDGNHKFDYVYNDIKNYFHLIKKNGIIGGHDWRNVIDIPVAVIKYCENNNIPYKNIKTRDSDWYIIKEE